MHAKSFTLPTSILGRISSYAPSSLERKQPPLMGMHTAGVSLAPENHQHARSPTGAGFHTDSFIRLVFLFVWLRSFRITDGLQHLKISEWSQLCFGVRFSSRPNAFYEFRLAYVLFLHGYLARRTV